MAWTKIVGALLLFALAGCGDSQSPDAQIRSVIEAMEQAAEARDVGDLAAHISPHFGDSYGRDGNDLQQHIRGYFIANQSIHLLTRISSIEFPTQDEARAQVTVAMVGRDAAAASAWDLAGEIYDFDVVFRLEDEEWKVTYATWASPGR